MDCKVANRANDNSNEVYFLSVRRARYVPVIWSQCLYSEWNMKSICMYICFSCIAVCPCIAVCLYCTSTVLRWIKLFNGDASIKFLWSYTYNFSDCDATLGLLHYFASGQLTENDDRTLTDNEAFVDQNRYRHLRRQLKKSRIRRADICIYGYTDMRRILLGNI